MMIAADRSVWFVGDLDDPFDAIAGGWYQLLSSACRAPSFSVPIAGISASWDAATSRTERTITLLLRRGAVAFAGSPAGRAGDHPQREKNDSLRKPGPCSRVRPAIGAEPALVVA